MSKKLTTVVEVLKFVCCLPDAEAHYAVREVVTIDDTKFNSNEVVTIQVGSRILVKNVVFHVIPAHLQNIERFDDSADEISSSVLPHRSPAA